MSRRLDPTRFVGALQDEHTDIPPGLTIADWRRMRAIERTRRASRRWWAPWRAPR
jgi:hypothetical protein